MAGTSYLAVLWTSRASDYVVNKANLPMVLYAFSNVEVVRNELTQNKKRKLTMRCNTIKQKPQSRYIFHVKFLFGSCVFVNYSLKYPNLNMISGLTLAQ